MALSREEATGGQRALQFSLRLARHCWEQLWKDNAPQMAAALTYRTIFGLVPLFVLALILFRAFGGFDDLSQQVQGWIYHYMGISTLGVNGAATEQAQSVEEIIRNLQARISNLSFATIGVVGLVLLIWAAIGLVVSVEDAFNQVYRAVRGRSWTMRITIYWAVMTLGPVLIGLSLWLTSQVTGWVGHVDTFLPTFGHWVLDVLNRGAALAATWGLLTLLYVLMPNTTVKLRPAAIGAFVAAVLWELAKWGFQLYVRNAVGYSALYGTLGLIPLFLFWLYVTWFIILFGLELTYTLHTMPEHGGEFEEKPVPAELLLDPRWLIPMLAAIGERFERGESPTIGDLAEQLCLPSSVITRLAAKLEEHKLVHRLEGGEQKDAEACYTLAMPPQRIAITRVLELGQGLGMDETAARHAPAHELIHQLDVAQHQAAGEMTLAEVPPAATTSDVIIASGVSTVHFTALVR